MTAVVRSVHGRERLTISGFHPLQPDEPGVVHARLQGRHDGTPLEGMLRLELRDGEWHEAGPAPDPRDASWHPDLDDHQALLVELARRVLQDLNRGSSIDFWPMSRGNISTGFEIEWGTTFNVHAVDDVDRGAGIADEHELDGIAHVRTIERMEAGYERLFAIEPYDDGSGVEGDFCLNVSKRAMLLTYTDHGGAQLELESTCEDGCWRHESRLVHHTPADPVTMMRIIAEPRLAVEDLLANYDVDAETEDAPVDALGEPAEPAKNEWRTRLSASIGAEKVIDNGNDVVIMVTPGTMFAQNS